MDELNINSFFTFQVNCNFILYYKDEDKDEEITEDIKMPLYIVINTEANENEFNGKNYIANTKEVKTNIKRKLQTNVENFWKNKLKVDNIEDYVTIQYENEDGSFIKPNQELVYKE